MSQSVVKAMLKVGSLGCKDKVKSGRISLGRSKFLTSLSWPILEK